MKSKKILRLALVLGLSCNSLGLNTYAMDSKSTPSEPAVSSDSSAYEEEKIFKDMRKILEDVYNQMDHIKMEDKQGNELHFYYEFNFLEGKSIEMKYFGLELSATRIKEELFCVIRFGIDLMLKRSGIILPSLDNENAFVFMDSEGKSLVEKWIKDCTFKSKIEEIVEPYVGKFVKKFQKQLSRCAMEEKFFKIAQGILEDVYKIVERLSERWWNKDEEINETSVRETLTNGLLSKIDMMMLTECNPTVVTSLENENEFVFMQSKGKSLIEKWKKDGTYDSNIDKIVEPYVNKFVKKFKKQHVNKVVKRSRKKLSEQEN